MASMRNVPRARAAATTSSASRRVEHERLLDEHRLARVDGEQGGVVVARVRRGDVDDVDLRVGGELGVRRVARRDAVQVGEGVGACLAARADGDDLGVGEEGEVADEGVAIQPVPMMPQRVGPARAASSVMPRVSRIAAERRAGSWVIAAQDAGAGDGEDAAEGKQDRAVLAGRVGQRRGDALELCLERRSRRSSGRACSVGRAPVPGDPGEDGVRPAQHVGVRGFPDVDARGTGGRISAS